MAWNTGDLVNSVKRTASIPAAQSTFSDQDILDIANEQMQSYIVPLITSQREDYFVTSIDVPLVVGTVSYRLPTRSVGQSLRQVYLVNAAGHVVNFPRISREDLEGASRGFYLEGNVLTIVIDDAAKVTQLGVSLRMMYHQRPNTMVMSGQAGVITAITTGSGTFTLRVASRPGSFAGSALYDLARGRPGFENLSIDLGATPSGSAVAPSMDFTGTVPADLVVGDTMCLSGECIFPQIPLEVHPLLYQRTAVKCLESLGDEEHMQSAVSALSRMEADAVKMLAPRVAGNIERIVNRGSIFRHFW